MRQPLRGFVLIMIKLLQTNKMLEQGYDTTQSQEYKDLIYGFSLAEKDNNFERKKINNYLLSKEYDGVSSVIWEIPYEINFAISMMNSIEHDINGSKINDYESNEGVKNIYLNIFPSNNKSYCIWSWIKENSNVYQEFANQFIQLETKDKVNYLNNQMPRWSDAIIISPKLWNKWDREIQESLIAQSNLDFLYRDLEEKELGFSYQYMDTPWDFFKELLE